MARRDKFVCPQCKHEWFAEEYNCRKCGHSWVGRTPNVPSLCPKCHSASWAKEPYPIRHCYRCGHEWRGRFLDKLPKRCQWCHSSNWNLEVKPPRNLKIKHIGNINISNGQQLLRAIFGEYFNESNDRRLSPQTILDILDGDLDQRERKILEFRFGFGNGEHKTLEETGKYFCVTRERIRQIQEKGLRKLRLSGNRHLLRPLVT